ncbi:MAG TPA: thioredoxin family protein [Candidatus Nanopelagicales bacterium]|nr:thioredoxin family protein [Candidatus Nanopelagicales bacterium]
MIGVLVLAGVLVAATAFGLWRRATDGRMRVEPGAVELPADPEGSQHVPGAGHGGGHAHEGDRMDASDLGVALGERATLVQFSSAFCAPCRTTRVVLEDVVGMVEGVTHVEVDAESHLDLVRRLDVRRTPTVLVLDSAGLVRVRAAGAPRKADVIAALGQVV